MSLTQCCLCHNHVQPQATVCRSCDLLLVVHGRYQLEQAVGKGGFGTVFLATDLQTGARRAVKRVQFDSQAEYDQIMVEVSINKEHQFLFVPKFYGAYGYHGYIYIVTAFVPGSSLENFPPGFWYPNRVERFLRVLLDYLATMHDAGVVHRDLSPINIMRTPENEYVLLDFGIAKDQTSTLSLVRGSGNPAYASPEQVVGLSTTKRSDLYCLGATAYKLLVGSVFSAADRLNGTILSSPKSVVSGVSPALNAALEAMLNLDHDERPTSARAVLRLMKSYELPAKSVRSSSDIPIGWIVGVLAVVIMGSIILISQFFHSDNSKSAFVGRLAYSSARNGDYDLFVADNISETPHPVTDRTGGEFAPVWSPDQSKLAFVSVVDGVDDICVLDMNTKVIENLTHSLASDATPAWSPDGARITFISMINNNYELFIMNADGSAPEQLTTNPGIDRSPIFVDENKILYVSERANDYGLYLLNAKDRVSTPVFLERGEKRTPSLSPDGTTIAFSMNVDDNWDIYTVRLDGSELQRLTDNIAEDGYPSWSADSKTIMFMSTRDQATNVVSSSSKLYIMRADGEDEMRVFDDATDDRHPAVTRPTATIIVTPIITTPAKDK